WPQGEGARSSANPVLVVEKPQGFKGSRIYHSAACLVRHPRLEHGPNRGGFAPDLAPWRGGRVVECTALEMRHRCKPIGGSNPSLSARPQVVRPGQTGNTPYLRQGRTPLTV